MAVLVNSVLIDRSPDVVFDYAVDLRNELKWNPGVESMVKVTEGPVGIGTKYKAKWKQSTHIDVECTRFERPDGWTYINGGPVEVILDISLQPQGNATLLTSRFDARPRGFFRLVFPIFLMMMKKQEKRNMASLKQAIEAKPQATSKAAGNVKRSNK